jgi:hypothetical protein
LSATGALACCIASGPTLGVYLGALILVTAITPPLLLGQDRWPNRITSLSAVVTPVAVIWLIAALRSDTRIGEWLAAVIVLSAYTLALSALASAMRTARMSAVVASALTVTLALAWLTWPIYLSRTWHGEASAPGVARLGNVHPGLAINAQLRHLGNWTEQSIAYHLTDLNQNVPFTPPQTIWPTTLFHATLAAALFALSFRRERRPSLTATAGPA